MPGRPVYSLSMGRIRRTVFRQWGWLTAPALLLVLCIATVAGLAPPPETLAASVGGVERTRYVDRSGVLLTVTYRNRWNVHHQVALHDMPELLPQAFVIAEDKRFYEHEGADWQARAHAAWQNVRAGRVVRGASTITEQVVRMLHPRPRTVWSRWLEGFEAARLERRFTKTAILEFYLNQVPYSGKRRGVAQAAQYYFGRSLDTLTNRELLVLAVMVRAPARLDPHRGTAELQAPLRRLASRMLTVGALDPSLHQQIVEEQLTVDGGHGLTIDTSHFIRYLDTGFRGDVPRRTRTTLDADLQAHAQQTLNRRLKDLRGRRVNNGAVLVVDHENDEILTWVNSSLHPSDIDAVLTRRQPGSTLKPFIYAMALEKGWSAATLIEDAPLTQLVGHGLHRYNNFSRRHYGAVRLRDALGNSLNIPAVRAAQYVGSEPLLATLQRLGIDSLRQHPDFYGDGIALGNGEVTLLELVRAYSVLARGGDFRSLRVRIASKGTQTRRRVFPPEVSSLIANILADADARKLEFGDAGLLQLPVQAAIKTGTSSDFRDAWTIGFNHRYTVGVWMGNLDYASTDGVTGAIGPAVVLRSVFAELNRRVDTQPLYLSPRLQAVTICRDTGLLADARCAARTEWFTPGVRPVAGKFDDARVLAEPRLRQPVDGLLLAFDPRIPADKQAFQLVLADDVQAARVQWWVDDELIATTAAGVDRHIWPLSRGRHRAWARVWTTDDSEPRDTAPVEFSVR